MFDAVSCKEIVLILDMSQFLNVLKLLGSENMSPNISTFEGVYQDLKHPSFVFVVLKKPKAQITSNYTRNLELPHSTEKPSRKPRKANAESDLCEPERLEFFREAVECPSSPRASERRLLKF